MLSTLLGRAGGGLTGGGGAGGAVATTWMREILFAVSVIDSLALVFVSEYVISTRTISYLRKRRQK